MCVCIDLMWMYIIFWGGGGGGGLMRRVVLISDTRDGRFLDGWGMGWTSRCVLINNPIETPLRRRY